MTSTKIKADILIHSLASAVLFPRPYKGTGTPVGWDIEERRDVSIAGCEGRIVWVGPAQHVCDHVNLQAGAELINAQGLTAVPGFVDAHTHLVYAGDRSNEFEMRVQGRPYLDILAAGGGILKTVESVRRLSEEQLFHEAAARAWKAIAWGVTTLEIKSGYGLDLESELKTLRVVRRLNEALPINVIATFMGAHAVPKEAKDNPDAFVDRICNEWIPVVAKEGLAQFNDVFTENKAFSVEQSRRILQAGVKHGLKPKIHADEINVLGGVDLAVEVGAVSADHLLKTGATGIARLAGSGVIPVLLPGTSTYLMESHHANARSMIAAGLPVAVASDFNPGSCQFYAAGLIQSLAMLQLKMSASEALIAGTLHGAFAVGLGAETGAIEVGRRMDLALVRAESFREIGYRAGENLVETVIAGGVPILHNEA